MNSRRFHHCVHYLEWRLRNITLGCPPPQSCWRALASIRGGSPRTWRHVTSPSSSGLSSDVNHKLNTDWEDNVALKVHACLDGLEVEWTSTDVVHIGEVGESSALWIGVIPKSLTGQVANIAAFGCFDVLIESGVTDVDVEISELSVTRSAGPKFLPPPIQP